MLEGVDKAGKTTQCKKLVHALQQSGRAAEMMRFPGNHSLQWFTLLTLNINNHVVRVFLHISCISRSDFDLNVTQTLFILFVYIN